MGQAKQRGTLEERKVQGIAAKAERERIYKERMVERARLRAERRANMTPEERAKADDAARAINLVMGMASMTMGFGR